LDIPRRQRYARSVAETAQYPARLVDDLGTVLALVVIADGLMMGVVGVAE
jgi:hypothetical protein